MESRRVSAGSNYASISNLRAMINLRSSKCKLPPALSNALDHLHLQGLDGLENHFLGADAFLKPWSQFRDRFLLLQPGSLPCSSDPDKLRGTDILWFYTRFSEGELRYDPRADDTSSLYTLDDSKYGTYDIREWGVEEHEKMLYAGLLQEFCVGKAHNPFGFRYFELKNVCSAWQTVFVPIVEAVRNSYDPKGRRHYGRLAAYIEERSPSRLAFPEGNVTVPQSANPYRVVSIPRRRGIINASEQRGSLDEELPQPVTKKEKLALDKELRDIYPKLALDQELRDIFPKYGQVVEKPKGGVLRAFIAGQKARITRSKREQQGSKAHILGKPKNGRESPMWICQGLDESGDVLDANVRNIEASRSSAEDTSRRSPRTTKEKKDKVVPYGMFGHVPAAKSTNTSLPEVAIKASKVYRSELVLPEPFPDEPNIEMKSKNMLPSLADVKPPHYANEAEDLYSAIRNSNPFSEDNDQSITQDMLSPMGFPSAIPKPLFAESRNKQPMHDQHREMRSRKPSYSGTGYDQEIKSSFIAHKMHATLEHNAFEPYSGVLKNELAIPLNTPWPGDESAVPQPIPWPGSTPTTDKFSGKYTENGGNITPTFSPSKMWPGPEDVETPPPIPPKHPARTASTRSSTGSHLTAPNMPRLLGPRIVSKENIRGHLRDVSRDLLREAEQRHSPPTPPKRVLEAYNSHMFPRKDRKGTPMGQWFQDTGRQNDDNVEMQALEKHKH